MTSSPTSRLYAKLCREQSQAEHSTELHPAREADRLDKLGAAEPAAAFRALAAHAAGLRDSFDASLGDAARADRTLGRIVAKIFSGSRHVVFDRFTDAERSYRATMLGIRHGVDCARLLGLVARKVGNVAVASWCETMLRERTPLIGSAEAALNWFADHPRA